MRTSMHFDAVLARDPVERLADAVHDALALGRQQRGEFDRAELVAHLGAEDRPQLLRQLLLGPARMYISSGSTIR